jgi:chromosome segregation ATPase
MADRISALEAEKAALESQIPNKKTAKGKTTVSDDTVTAQIRYELAEALRAKGVSDARWRAAEEELRKLRTKTKSDSTTLKRMEAERDALRTRLNDLQHEASAKRQHHEGFQDEIVALNLQLAMADKEVAKVKKENKELIDRWMKRMAQEADAMNLANEGTSR